MTIAIVLSWATGLTTGWLLTSASAAAEMRRKCAEWEAKMAAMERAKLVAIREDPNCPKGSVYLWTGGGKGDAA